jgi:NAD(P)-dependent dehydrogenase (short-subunit alcohol dehydrogenase family)
MTKIRTLLVGGAASPMWTDVWRAEGGPGDMRSLRTGIASEDVTDQLSAVIVVTTGRVADPEEIAALVVFLASGRVLNMSGTTS